MIGNYANETAHTCDDWSTVCQGEYYVRKNDSCVKEEQCIGNNMLLYENEDTLQKLCLDTQTHCTE